MIMGESESREHSNTMQIPDKNKELVDNLIRMGYIRTRKVEQVFRAIDRANYVLSSHIGSAYMDFAWKHGNLHLSSLSVYSKVMEGLSLKPGMSFLNLGSGTGYLNTMAGLILTQSGINHGVELHEDCVQYSYERLEEFKKYSSALDVYDFCEPSFIQGNCLNLVTDKLYDRVYCGAACSDDFEVYMKKFVKIGGILVMPIQDKLCRYKRTGDKSWEVLNILPVTFAALIVPTDVSPNVSLPVRDPLSLQELCRGNIRCKLRQRIWHEHSGLVTKKRIRRGYRMAGDVYPRPFTRFGVESRSCTIMLDSDETSDGESDGYNDTLQDYFEPRNMLRVLMAEGRHLVGIVTHNENRSEENSSDSETEEPSEVPNSENSPASGRNSSSSEVVESDSDLDSETTPRKKVARRDEPNDSGNSNAQSSTDAGENSDVEEMEGAENPASSEKHRKHKRKENRKNGHYIDDEAFSILMTEKIRNLPLPLSLKTYVHYKRYL